MTKLIDKLKESKRFERSLIRSPTSDSILDCCTAANDALPLILSSLDLKLPEAKKEFRYVPQKTHTQYMYKEAEDPETILDGFAIKYVLGTDQFVLLYNCDRTETTIDCSSSKTRYFAFFGKVNNLNFDVASPIPDNVHCAGTSNYFEYLKNVSAKYGVWCDNESFYLNKNKEIFRSLYPRNKRLHFFQHGLPNLNYVLNDEKEKQIDDVINRVISATKEYNHPQPRIKKILTQGRAARRDYDFYKKNMNATRERMEEICSQIQEKK